LLRAARDAGGIGDVQEQPEIDEIEAHRAAPPQPSDLPKADRGTSKLSSAARSSKLAP
jgi:hypothetical protein